MYICGEKRYGYDSKQNIREKYTSYENIMIDFSLKNTSVYNFAKINKYIKIMNRNLIILEYNC